MIIDAHYHRTLEVTEEVVENRFKYIVHAAESIGKKIDLEAIKQKSLALGDDPTGERLIESMDQDGIDMTVICSVDNLDSGNSVETVLQTNQAVGSVAQRFPSRIIALAGVDPRRAEAPEILKRCFDEFGFRGLKYHPDNGYHPCSPESYKLLEMVEQRKGVLLSHTSPLMPPARCALAEPMLLADIGVDFPEIKVIAAHMGALNWRPWASLAHMQPNMYGDLAMWDAFAVGNIKLFRRELRDLIDYAGISKVLFGTDAPILSMVIPIKQWIQIIQELPDHNDDGIIFTKDEVAAILGGNAAKVYGIVN